MHITNSNNIHVLPRNGEWIVKNEGVNNLISLCKTQKEAIGFARNIAKQQKAAVVIHGRDGRIRNRDSYSSKPLPHKEDREVLYPVTATTGSKVRISRAVKRSVEMLTKESKQ